MTILDHMRRLESTMAAQESSADDSRAKTLIGGTRGDTFDRSLLPTHPTALCIVQLVAPPLRKVEAISFLALLRTLPPLPLLSPVPPPDPELPSLWRYPYVPLSPPS